MVCLGNMCMDTLHKGDNDDDDDDDDDDDNNNNNNNNSTKALQTAILDTEHLTWKVLM